MAVLWEQREMVGVLQQLEAEELGRLPYEGATPEEQVHHTYSHPNGYGIWESVLIKEMLRIQEKNGSDIAAINANQKVLNACIREGFIVAGDNKGFTDITTFPLPAGTNPNNNSSRRRVSVSDKGLELLEGKYYYLKYIPETFQEPTKIAVSVVTSILISIATVLLVLLGIGHQGH